MNGMLIFTLTLFFMAMLLGGLAAYDYRCRPAPAQSAIRRQLQPLLLPFCVIQTLTLLLALFLL